MEQPTININKKTTKDIIFTILRQKSYFKLFKKYSSNSFSYNKIAINNIIYNEPCLIVAKFKDFLIYDDNTEFFRKFYPKSESMCKLYKILDLYENYSKIFPNYLVVKERKYMYKNIRRKQKMIDAFNQIKAEEEENRRNLKEKQNNNEEDQNNKLFTDIVKDEIKLFQKDNTNKRYKNSFDSENDKEDTLFGRSHSSISFNLINKKELLTSKGVYDTYDSSKGKSFDSIRTSETNGTISCLLNVMNDNKIYIKDLPNMFKVNYCPNNNNKVIEEKIISIRKNKNSIYKVPKINDTYKNRISCNNINNINNIILQKIILTPEKRNEEVNLVKKNSNFNSTLLTKKRIKILNPSSINSNSNSVCKENKIKDKNIPQKQNIYIPQMGNTIININNNFYHQISKTERLDPPVVKKVSNLNQNTNLNFNTINSSREKDNNIFKKNLNLNNKIVLSNQKINITKNRYNYIKCKHVSHDFSNKRYIGNDINNKNNNANSLFSKAKRLLSPQYTFGLIKNKLNKDDKNDKRKNSNQKNDNKINSINYLTKLNLYSINNINDNSSNINIKDNDSNNIKEYVKIDFYNTQKSQKSSSEKQNFKNIKKNNFYLSKENNKKKILTLSNNPKYNLNEYSSLSFVNITKTESNINNQTLNKIAKSKKRTNLCDNYQKTYYNLLKHKKINKDLLLQDKLFSTFNFSKEKTKISQNINELFSKMHTTTKTTDSYNSKEKNKDKNIKKIFSVKNKILKSETKIPSDRYISNYMNKSKYKNSIEKYNTKNNFFEYTMISSNSSSKNKNMLLSSKTIEKRKKCESIDFVNNSNNEFSNHKKLILKLESLKRKGFINSPKNSFSQFLNRNNNKKKIITDYLTERPYLFNQSLIPKKHLSTISQYSQNDIRSKYKNFILEKNNKKSYDFNSDTQTKYNQKILNKINNLKNNKNMCISSIKKNSNSFNLNNINYSNYNTYYNHTLRNKSKEREDENDSKDLFKKIMSYKISKNKKEDKFIKNNNIKNLENSNKLHFTIKVNTSNFLSKIKSKYKKE